VTSGRDFLLPVKVRRQNSNVGLFLGDFIPTRTQINPGGFEFGTDNDKCLSSLLLFIVGKNHSFPELDDFNY
jgi:hypothetical protein